MSFTPTCTMTYQFKNGVTCGYYLAGHCTKPATVACQYSITGCTTRKLDDGILSIADHVLRVKQDEYDREMIRKRILRDTFPTCEKTGMVLHDNGYCDKFLKNGCHQADHEDCPVRLKYYQIRLKKGDDHGED